MKKIIGFVLVICMVVTPLPAVNLSARAADDTLNHDRSDLWGLNGVKDAADNVMTSDESRSVTMAASAGSDIWDGSTTDTDWYTGHESENSYTISTAEALAGLAGLVNTGTDTFSGKTITLGNDIVLNNTTNWDSWDDTTEGLNPWIPIGIEGQPFCGTFDGDGHTICGIYISTANSDYQGLFGAIYEGATVKNVGVIESYILGDNEVGGVVGGSYETISNCCNTGGASGRDEGDSTAPTLVSVTPTGTDAAAAGDILVTFNEAMNPSVGTISLDHGADAPSSDTWSGEGTVYTAAYSGLDSETTYTITISEFKDAAGNVMANDGSHTFTTASAPTSTILTVEADTSWYNAEDTAFTINTAAELAGLASLVNDKTDDFSGKTITLGNDIVLNDVSDWENWTDTTEGLKSWTPIGMFVSEDDYSLFNGTFDGAGHTVSGIYISAADSDYQGLFYATEDGIIKNVGIIKSFIKGNSYVGGLVGANYDAIDNCYNTGTIIGTGECVGGVSGENKGMITNCCNTGSVEGTGECVGGVAGCSEGTMNNCCNTGNVSGSSRVGGVVGYSLDITRNCYNTGNVSGTECVGGVAGQNDEETGECTVENCYNTGRVSGTKRVGGVIGYNLGITKNCYSAGSVSGDSQIGGVAGENSGIISKCFYDNERCVVGGINDSDVEYYAVGKSSDDMKKTNTFTDAWWDSSVWKFQEGQYPQLQDLWIYEANTSWYDGHEDEANYTIYTAEDLAGLASLVNGGTDFTGKTITLGNDIVLNDVSDWKNWTDTTEGLKSWMPIGNGWHHFLGTFDGGGHTVSGIYISNDADYQGLFGRSGYDEGDRTAIKNVGIINSYIKGGHRTGALAGNCEKCDIVNCYSTANIKGEKDSIGGLVGYTYSVEITSCCNVGSVEGTESVGGIVGENGNYNVITSCCNTGSVKGTEKVGGVAGSSCWGSSITKSYNTGSVVGTEKVGGVAGYDNGTIENCYNTGRVVGDSCVGGIAGDIECDTIKACYNNGIVVGTDNMVGGVIGSLNKGENEISDSYTIAHCYYDSEVTGSVTAIGGISDEDALEKAEGKTTTEMQTDIAFDTWDDETIWLFELGKYPQLRDMPELPVIEDDPEEPEPVIHRGGHARPNTTSVLVNGKFHTAGTAKTETDSKGKKHKTVTVDTNRLENILDSEGSGATVTVPVTGSMASTSGVLNGKMVKIMEGSDATLIIQTDSGAYTLPASQINIDAVSEQIGTNVPLSDIIVTVSIAGSSDEMAQVIEDAAADEGYAIMVPPLDYTISCEYSGQMVNVNNFNGYVTRSIAIPAGVDHKKITTAVVVDPDGTERHVPTTVSVMDGQYYAVINSLTNSTYVLINNDASFADAEGTWYEAIVNEMAGRKILNGRDADTFDGDCCMTRAEFAAVVVRALGLPDAGASAFDDVSESAWYTSYVATAVQYGIVGGVGGNRFEPTRNITRQEAMVMIMRAVELTPFEATENAKDLSGLYTDYGTEFDWAKAAVAFNLNNGFIVGSGDTFRPHDNITRAEVSTVVLRLLQNAQLIDIRTKV